MEAQPKGAAFVAATLEAETLQLGGDVVVGLRVAAIAAAPGLVSGEQAAGLNAGDWIGLGLIGDKLGNEIVGVPEALIGVLDGGRRRTERGRWFR